MIGTSLSHYRITSLLGAGGMGEVYRATDTRLDRDVAIKVLPDSLARDAERLARFQREAHLLASLGHPNIAAIHGLEESDGKPFLVLELAEGEDLATRLKQGPIPVGEAIAIAKQIAEALEEAHEKGIVHRDLKPANIKVSANDRVKVLDFGLAKAYAGDAAGASSADLSQSPTLAHTGTQAGVILGTAAYMSPEQARGKVVDKRADIWAFGVVLFEMLTGKQLFTGETVSDTLAAVLRQDVDWHVLPPATPAPVLRVLHRCLVRDPKARLHDIADARIEIEEAVRDTGLPGAVGATLGKPARKWTWGLLAGLALSIGLALGFAAARIASQPRASPRIRFVVTPPGEESQLRSVRLSRDGRRLVYAGIALPGLVVRELGSFESRVLPGTEGGATPFLSPDGEWVGFFADGKIKKVAIAGGDPVTICEAGNSPGAAWGPGGTILFSPTWTTGLFRVDASGGKPAQVTSPDRSQGQSAHFWPEFLPEGAGVLFTIFGGSGLSDSKVALLDLSTSRYEVLFAGAAPRYVAGEIVFYRGGSYHAAPFDPSRRRVTGPERAVLADVRRLNPLGEREWTFDFSETGLLAYVPGDAPRNSPNSRLAWISRDGRIDPLPFEGHHGENMSLSPDGRRLAVTRFEKGDFQVWIYDLERGTMEQLTHDGQNFDPTWHPEGSRLAFTSALKGDWDVRSMSADGSRPPEPLVVTDKDEYGWRWLADGLTGIFLATSPESGDDIWTSKVNDPASPRLLLGTPLAEADPAVSPDGRWLAYRSGSALYVARHPEVTDRVLIASNARSPRWSRASPELFYAEKGRLMTTRYDGRAGVFRPIATVALFDVPRLLGNLDFDVAPDGTRFLFRVPVEGRAVKEMIHVVVDGLGELRGAAPGGGR